jgi:hypothetical protein
MTGRYRWAAGLGTALIVLMSAGTALAASASNTLLFEDDNGVPYSVTALAILLAEPSDEFNAPSPGDYLVAVEFRVKDISASYDVSDDADVDATVVGSDNQTYTASFDTVTECTNFDHGDFQLGPGESSTGCVVFELSDAIRVTEVKWVTATGVGRWPVTPTPSPKRKTTPTTAAPPQTPLVLSVRATPSTLGYAGGTVQVAGEVKSATSCQLQLLSHQGFRVLYASNNRPCTNTFAARVTIGRNPSPVARVVTFALVARNGPREFSGRFYVLLAAKRVVRPPTTTPPTAPVTTPGGCPRGTVTGVITNQIASGPQGNYEVTVRITNKTTATVEIVYWHLPAEDDVIEDVYENPVVLAPGASTTDTVGGNTGLGPLPAPSKDPVSVGWFFEPSQYVGCS